MVIEDAAQAIGGTLGGRKCGVVRRTSPAPASIRPSRSAAMATAARCSPTTTRWRRALRSFAFHGKGETQYDNIHVGLNSRLDTLQAAILIEKLAILEEEMVARQKVAKRYADGLGDVVKAAARSGRQPLGLGPICHRDAAPRRAQGASAERRHPDASSTTSSRCTQIAYREFPRTPTGLPVSEALPERILCLPMHPYLSVADQDRIIGTIRSFLERQPRSSQPPNRDDLNRGFRRASCRWR